MGGSLSSFRFNSLCNQTRNSIGLRLEDTLLIADGAVEFVDPLMKRNLLAQPVRDPEDEWWQRHPSGLEPIGEGEERLDALGGCLHVAQGLRNGLVSLISHVLKHRAEILDLLLALLLGELLLGPFEGATRLVLERR